MQPYVFPYLGYFQLVNAVDVFVFYDDVHFIKQGWINRNKIYGIQDSILFTIPLIKASSNRLIHETEINVLLYPNWKNKFIKTLVQNYSKAPYFEEVFPILKGFFNIDYRFISDMATRSILLIMDYVEIYTTTYLSSNYFSDCKGMVREERLKCITAELNASNYINTMGGIDLYDKEDFRKSGINLKFLKSNLQPYKQFERPFIPGLSIIDVLMFNSKEEIKFMLNTFELL